MFAFAHVFSSQTQTFAFNTDLQLGIQGFQRWDPDLKAKSQHELENARESLLFCRQFFKEDRNRSVALAQVILFLTMPQGSLDNPEMELEDVHGKPTSTTSSPL